MKAVRGKNPHMRKPVRRLSVVETLTSVRFAVGIVILLALACVAGTLIPQGPDAARYVEAHPESAPRLALLNAAGLTRVYTAWWFLGLMFVLSASVATCSSKRFKSILNTRGFARRRALGSMLTHISILLILAGGIVRGVWGVRGYVELREGEIQTEFLTERGARPLPAAVRLNRFEVEKFDQPEGDRRQKPGSRLLVRWPEKNLEVEMAMRLNEPRVISAGGSPEGAGDFRVEVLRYEPDFVIDPETREVGSRSTEPKNPAVLVSVEGAGYRNHRWLFARYPGFSTRSGGAHEDRACPLDIVYEAPAPAEPAASNAPIKSFRSHVEFLPPNGSPAVSRTIEVNGPASFGGFTFYQSGYRPEQPDWTALQVVRDPGVPLVYAGFILMISGLSIVFYLNPWLKPRRSSP
jgi:hypothetical protein